MYNFVSGISKSRGQTEIIEPGKAGTRYSYNYISSPPICKAGAQYLLRCGGGGGAGDTPGKGNEGEDEVVVAEGVGGELQLRRFVAKPDAVVLQKLGSGRRK